MSSLYDKCVPMINALLYTKPYPSSSPTSIAQTLTVGRRLMSCRATHTLRASSCGAHINHCKNTVRCTGVRTRTDSTRLKTPEGGRTEEQRGSGFGRLTTPDVRRRAHAQRARTGLG